MKLKVIFDKEKTGQKYISGWGMSYLIDDKVLFDTGESSQYLIQNLKAMNINIEKIEKVVISHKHLGHIGGLEGLLEVNKQAQVFTCEEIKDMSEVATDIYSSGCLKVNYKGEDLLEQALILHTEKGVSLICGCTHPGILQFTKKAREKFPKEEIYSVIGGLHFIDKDKRFIEYVLSELKKQGVKNIGPSHCTGFEAKNLLRGHYPDNFLDIKVGLEIEL
jgi:7,8-dihydropterin-6-yl-methyl-4-(beta-D-ribofuranosyl)aminobenzene 5'-phosphate synthase